MYGEENSPSFINGVLAEIVSEKDGGKKWDQLQWVLHNWIVILNQY
jgi:hypothetical protein